jgi:hypothetical protein
VNAIRERQADLLSAAGHQDMHTFWERVIQPQMFALLAARYGGTEHVSNATRPEDAIASGQFIAVWRAPYEALGGHAAVRSLVAEDMALAQLFIRAGRRMVLLFATRQLSIRMYTSLRDIVGERARILRAGAGCSAARRAIFPSLLLGLPVIGLIPPVAFARGVWCVIGTAAIDKRRSRVALHSGQCSTAS